MSGVFRNTMWNESIPPDIRGRMAGIEMISYSVVDRWSVPCRTHGGVDDTALLTHVWRIGLHGIGRGRRCGTAETVAFDSRTDLNVANVRELRSGEQW